MKRIMASGLMAIALASMLGCKSKRQDSDAKQQAQQEHLLQEATAATGMPAVRNFRERKILREIIEMRDQADLVTHTYLVAHQTGRLVFFCSSIGYGFPAATQFTSPQKVVDASTISGTYQWVAVPQADPNGLFSPESAEGTWVMCKDPAGPDVKPVYVEERIVVAPFPLATAAQPERQ